MKGRAFAAVVLSALLLLSGLGIGGWWLLWQRGPLQLAHQPLTMPRAARFVPSTASFSLYLFSDGQRPVDYARAVAPARQRRPAGEAIARLRDGAFAAAGLDYQDELAGWLGDDIAMALFEDPLAVATAGRPEQPVRGWLLALSSRDDDGARRFLQRFWQTRSLAGTDLQVSRYRGLGLISGRGALLGGRPEPLATALVDDDLVLIASGRNLLERALDVSQIPELNQAGQPLLRQGVATFASGAALAVASPSALQGWLGLPPLQALTAAPAAAGASLGSSAPSSTPTAAPRAVDTAAGEPTASAPAGQQQARDGHAPEDSAGSIPARIPSASDAGRSDRQPTAATSQPEPRAFAPSSEVSAPAVASGPDPSAAGSAAADASAPGSPSGPSGPASSGSAGRPAEPSDAPGQSGPPARDAGPGAQLDASGFNPPVAGGPNGMAGDPRPAALPLSGDRPAPASLRRRLPWAALPANALTPTAVPRPALAAPSLLAVLQPQGRELELRAQLLWPEAPRLTPLQPGVAEPLLAALRGSPTSLALLQDPAALGRVTLLRPLLERSLGLRPQPLEERQGPLPGLLAVSVHGPLLASQAQQGWQLASKAGDPATTDLEPLLRQEGLLEAPLDVEGHSLRVWTRLTLPGRAGRRERGAGDALLAPLAGWSERRQELAWWGQSLAALEAPAESRALTALKRGLHALGAPEAPLQWSLDGDAARDLLRACQPWRLLSALAGGGLDGPVRGLALAVESPPEGQALELRVRLDLGA